MHSRIAFALSAVLNAVGAFGASVDPFKCYTLTTGGSNYLDSSDSVLNVENHPNRQALIDDNDKGVSFRFPGGMGGPVVCQAHNDHRVGLANDGNTAKLDGQLKFWMEAAELSLRTHPRRGLSVVPVDKRSLFGTCKRLAA
uniref:Uncharacterized protein n=1 Tax=Moniliophthora roreri TaxID=221103 RepID=A0A0W0FTL8_MONRR